MWKEKFAGYLLDISKYILTGVVIASLFKDFGENKLLIYAVGVFTAIIGLATSLYIYTLVDQDNKKKKSKKK